jgi:hypothetical protein
MADNTKYVWLKPSDTPAHGYPKQDGTPSPSPTKPQDPLSEYEVNKYRNREDSKAKRNLFGTSGKKPFF